MEYDTKEVKTETNVIHMSKEEYDILNDIYKTGLNRRLGNLINIDNINRMILTDGWHRLELIICVDKEKEVENK